MMISRAQSTVLALLVSIFAISRAFAFPFHETRSILLRLQDEATPVREIWREACRLNPATMEFLDSLSISCAGTSFSFDSGTWNKVPQTGNGKTFLELGAKSYFKLSDRSTLWGNASYTNTLIRNVSYCNILDYYLLGPYTLGDSIGGNLRCKQYRIGGGWSHIYRNWSIGISAEYRAETAHRSKDPRVKDIVSQLDISAGCSRKLRNLYILGLKGDFTTYSQTSEVKFLNPANSIMTQLYTGLGSTFKRFGGNITTVSAHSMHRYGGGIQLLPYKGTGLILKMGITNIQTTMFLRGLNNVPFGKTSTLLGEGLLGWTHYFNRNLQFAPQLCGLLMKRTGTENIFGSASGSRYPVIGSRVNYKQDILYSRLSLSVLWRRADNYLSVEFNPCMSIGKENRRLLSSSLSESAKFITPEANAAVRILPSAKIALWVEGEISRRYMSEPNSAVSASAGINYAIGKSALHFQLRWTEINNFDYSNGRQLATSLSIIF